MDTRPMRLPRLQTAFAVNSVGEGSQIPMHTHAEAELVLVVQGHVRIRVAGQELDGPEGTLHMLPPGIPHEQRCRAPWMTHCVLFEQGERVIEETPRTLDVGGDARLRRWIADLCEAQPHWPPAGMETQGDEVGEGLLLAVLRTISRRERQDHLREEMHPQLLRAVEFLHAHAAEDVPRGVLADTACVSGSHLSALFRQRFGCGPLQYQQRLRLEAAQALLRNPYLSVEEVACRCGYQDANYFARLFRRVTGLRPSQWRSTRQKGAPTEDIPHRPYR